MDRRWHSVVLRLLPRLLATGLLPVASAADTGYLPAVGPPPLRFIAPRAPNPASTPNPEPGAPHAALTLTHGPTPAATTPGATNTNTSVTANTNDTTGSPTNAPAEPALEPLIGPPAPDVAEPPVASPELLTTPPIVPNANQTILPQPQLFLQYFTPDYISGSNGYGIVVPISFVPPQLRPSPSSSATYLVAPAEKIVREKK